jgi:hypothetical protein
MQRWRIAALVALSAVCLTGVILHWTIPSVQLSYKLYGRISHEMTLKDVEALFGGPPGKYRTIECVLFETQIVDDSGCNDPSIAEWESSEGSIQVEFDESGHVKDKDYSSIGIEKESIFKLIRHEIKRRFR